jgi:hypothetical protein
LYYTERGFEIEINRQSSGFGDEIQLMPADPIDWVWLFKPTTIKDRSLSLGLGFHESDLRDWKGYGNLLDLYYYK